MKALHRHNQTIKAIIIKARNKGVKGSKACKALTL